MLEIINQSFEQIYKFAFPELQFHQLSVGFLLVLFFLLKWKCVQHLYFGSENWSLLDFSQCSPESWCKPQIPINQEQQLWQILGITVSSSRLGLFYKIRWKIGRFKVIKVKSTKQDAAAKVLAKPQVVLPQTCYGWPNKSSFPQLSIHV